MARSRLARVRGPYIYSHIILVDCEMSCVLNSDLHFSLNFQSQRAANIFLGAEPLYRGFGADRCTLSKFFLLPRILYHKRWRWHQPQAFRFASTSLIRFPEWYERPGSFATVDSFDPRPSPPDVTSHQFVPHHSFQA